MPQSFWTYLRTWFKAAFSPAWDVFGGLGLTVSALIWAWHRFWPGPFASAAGVIGFSQEAAMSDLVWEIPLWFGLAVFSYRLVKAPYELHRKSLQDAETSKGPLITKLDVYRRSIDGLLDQIKELKHEQQQATGFSIDIDAGGLYVTANDPAVRVTLPGVWAFFYTVVITNQTEKQLPLEIWLHVGMRADGSWRMGEVCQTTLPAWAVSEALQDDTPFERLINLPARSAVSGFCAAHFGHDVLGMAGVRDAKELANTRPFWLEIKNKLTGESRFRAMNTIASQLELRP